MVLRKYRKRKVGGEAKKERDAGPQGDHKNTMDRKKVIRACS